MSTVDLSSFPPIPLSMAARLANTSFGQNVVSVARVPCRIIGAAVIDFGDETVPLFTLKRLARDDVAAVLLHDIASSTRCRRCAAAVLPWRVFAQRGRFERSSMNVRWRLVAGEGLSAR